MEPLAEEAIEPFRRRTAQAEIEIQVEAPRYPAWKLRKMGSPQVNEESLNWGRCRCSSQS